MARGNRQWVNGKRNSLSPLTTGPSNPGIEVERRGGTLRGWDLYAKLVALDFAAAPDVEKRALPAFRALVKHVDVLFRRMQSRVKVVFVDEQTAEAGDSARALHNEMLRTGILRVSKMYNQSNEPYWSAETNLKNRAIHDYYTHFEARTKPGGRLWAFDNAAELHTYQKHLQLLGPRGKALPALFTELVGQLCYEAYFGDFPTTQKIILLPRFDYVRLGAVKGYQVSGGTLLPVRKKGILSMLQGSKAGKAGKAGNREPSPQNRLYRVQMPFYAAELKRARKESAMVRAFTDKLTQKDLKGCEAYLTPDGRAGFAVSNTGELQGVFSTRSGVGQGLREAIAASSAKTGFCMGEFLRNYYETLGFRVVRTVAWDDKFAPPPAETKLIYEKCGVRPQLYWLVRE